MNGNHCLDLLPKNENWCQSIIMRLSWNLHDNFCGMLCTDTLQNSMFHAELVCRTLHTHGVSCDDLENWKICSVKWHLTDHGKALDLCRQCWKLGYPWYVAQGILLLLAYARDEVDFFCWPLHLIWAAWSALLAKWCRKMQQQLVNPMEFTICLLCQNLFIR